MQLPHPLPGTGPRAAKSGPALADEIGPVPGAQYPEREMRDALQCFFLSRFSRRYTTLTWRRKLQLFQGVHGQMLEIGAGTGVNFEFIPAGVHWTGVDPNPRSLRYIGKAANRTGHEFEFRQASAGALPFPEASFDYVACTLTLCSVEDPVQVLEEIRRVLRPGGEFLFMEHVAAAAGSPLLRRQRLLRPVFRCLAGCTPDRDTGSLLRAAHFSALEMEQFELSVPVVSPHICGRAVR